MTMEMVMDIVLDGLLDSLKLIPFLLLTYLIMEYLEHKTSTRTRALVRKAGKLGPLAGSVAGVFPQCGFSAAAANLYSGGVITIGTLLAVFLSTSDEMLPIFVSESMDVRLILTVLGIKLLLGTVTGFLVDFIFHFRPSLIQYKEIHNMCESEHCGCDEGIFVSALRHTIKIFLFILGISIFLGALIELCGEDRLADFMSGHPVFGSLFAGLVGLIPNCASSVVITQLYVNHLISFGTMMSGLLVGAGVGLLILFRTNKRWKENAIILLLLYIFGVAWGTLIDGIIRIYC